MNASLLKWPVTAALATACLYLVFSIMNTGQYLWPLPAGMPTHRVYLRVTATDRAGNRSEVVTREPITVDLMKPKARIVAPTASDLSPRP